MPKEDTSKIDGKDAKVSKEIAEKIDATCKEVVLAEEVANLKKQLMEQLRQADDNFVAAKQQMTLWDTRKKQVTGSIATCNTLWEKKQKAKVLKLEGNNTGPEGK